jgi:Cu(I)/Ag(I) efflux system membrane fusion protein
MMKMKIDKRNFRNYTLILVAGLILGWLFFHGSGNKTEAVHDHTEDVEESTIWTCSMHPQIRMDKPGKCPICSMDLIPLETISAGDESLNPNEIEMSESAIKLAEIQTMPVRKDYSNKEVYLLGKVKPDERNIAELTSRFGGRIENLFVNFTGQNVSKGEKLATIYSPELVTAQKELIEAVEYKESNPAFYRAARNKLKLWDLTESQIDGIESKGEPQNYFDVLSPISGTVTMRHVSLGDYVKEGNALFQVINLRRVWVMFEAYESDLPWLHEGDRVEFKVQSLPGESFAGKVTNIDPFLNPRTRIANVRVEVENPDLELKPEMFANGIIKPRVSSTAKDLLIPKTSVLWTGKRAVVYVKDPDRETSSFLYREITLGPEAGDFYVVKDGLSEGEKIATNGVFKIDAAAQLEGKPSMMNPEAGRVTMAHNHGSMDGSMEGSKGSSDEQMEMDAGNESMENEAIPGEVDPTFKKELQEVYNAYINMKNAFVASDAKKVQAEADKVKSDLDAVDMELLKGDLHMKWMSSLNIMESEISNISGTGDLSEQRVAFAKFNDAFYKSLELFGIQDGVVYYQYCPMANGNEGAYWLSEIDEIRNPYFGDEMLTCGENRDTLEFK